MTDAQPELTTEQMQALSTSWERWKAQPANRALELAFCKLADRLGLPFYPDETCRTWRDFYELKPSPQSQRTTTATATATQKGQTDMKTDEFFQSKWLRGDDLKGKAYKVTVQAVTVEEMKNKDGLAERKLCVQFQGIKKPLVLNKTNYLALVATAGGSKDTDAWIGKTVILRPEEVTAFGETTLSVRIKQVEVPLQVVEPEPEPSEPEWFTQGVDDGLAGLEAA